MKKTRDQVLCEIQDRADCVRDVAKVLLEELELCRVRGINLRRGRKASELISEFKEVDCNHEIQELMRVRWHVTIRMANEGQPNRQFTEAERARVDAAKKDLSAALPALRSWMGRVRSALPYDLDENGLPKGGE